MQTLHKNNEKGFTLIELLMVLAIIGVLASIAIPQFSSMREKALDTVSVSDLKQMAIVQELFKVDTLNYAAFAIADKVGSSVSVNTVGGTMFAISSLSKEVEMLCKTDASGQFLIIAARHIGSGTVLAIDMSAAGTIRILKNQSQLTAALIPAPTSANDLASWVKL